MLHSNIQRHRILLHCIICNTYIMDFFYCDVCFCGKTKILGLCINNDKNLVRQLNHIPISKKVILFQFKPQDCSIKNVGEGMPMPFKRRGALKYFLFRQCGPCTMYLFIFNGCIVGRECWRKQNSLACSFCHGQAMNQLEIDLSSPRPAWWHGWAQRVFAIHSLLVLVNQEYFINILSNRVSAISFNHQFLFLENIFLIFSTTESIRKISS